MHIAHTARTSIAIKKGVVRKVVQPARQRPFRSRFFTGYLPGSFDPYTSRPRLAVIIPK